MPTDTGRSRTTSSGAPRPRRTRSRAPAHEDGRGESVWDRFARRPARCETATPATIACDFYHRYPRRHRADARARARRVPLLDRLAARRPGGRGRVNKAASTSTTGSSTSCSRRHRAVRHALPLGLPQALEDEGGWPARATAEAFVEYTEAVVAGSATASGTGSRTTSRGSRVDRLRLGRARAGPHERGRRLAAAHHLLLSHGWAVEVIARAPAPRSGSR